MTNERGGNGKSNSRSGGLPGEGEGQVPSIGKKSSKLSFPTALELADVRMGAAKSWQGSWGPSTEGGIRVASELFFVQHRRLTLPASPSFEKETKKKRETKSRLYNKQKQNCVFLNTAGTVKNPSFLLG